MAATARRKWALVVGALVLATSLILILEALGSREYAFVARLGGQRNFAKERERFETPQVEHIGVRYYTFKAPSNKVLAAMTKELSGDGWGVADKDGTGSVLFLRPEHDMAFFSPGQDSCTVMIRRSPNWFTSQWETLEDRLGIR